MAPKAVLQTASAGPSSVSLGAVRLPKKTLSIHERINNIVQLDDEVIFNELTEELEQEIRDSVVFRHSAPSTQARQNRILHSFRRIIRRFHNQPEDLSDEETDKLGFPEDFDALLRNLQYFLILTYKASSARGEYSQHTMRYSSFVQYRNAMMFWAKYMYEQRNLEPPSRVRLYNAITKLMRSMQSKNWQGKQPRRSIKEGLGIIELRQLLDHSMTFNVSHELAEQHQAIWCIGRQTACRPGSIGWIPQRPDNYLRWRNIQFINKGDGNFQSIITFENLKTNRDDPEEAPGGHRTLVAYMDTPNADNIVFSVPHRLLIIGLRRKLLVGVETISDILNYELVNLRIKPKHLDDPVFYPGTPGGRGLNTSGGGMAAGSIAAYLVHQGRAMGYTDALTLYSIRRRAATDLVPIVGWEKTRQIMGHAPDTTTLERFYVHFGPQLAVTAATLGEEVGQQGFKKDGIAYAPVARNQLDVSVRQDIQGPALRNLIEQITSNDPGFPSDGDKKTLKIYFKRVRRFARATLINQARATHADNQTIHDTRQQNEEFAKHAAAFAQRVRDAARRFLEEPSAEVEEELGEDEEDGDEQEEDIEYDEAGNGAAEEPEEDIETRVALTDDGILHLHSVGEEFEEQRGDIDSSPKENIGLFLEVLWHNLLKQSSKPWTEMEDFEKTCPLCEADDTIPAHHKNRVWNFKVKLENHMTTGIEHSPFGLWRRQQHILAKEEKKKNPNETHIYRCRLADCGKKYTNVGNLWRHLENIIQSKEDQPEHYDAITAEGMTDIGFMGVPSKHAVSRRAKDAALGFARSGLRFGTPPKYQAAVWDEKKGVYWGAMPGLSREEVKKRWPNMTFGKPTVIPDYIKTGLSYGKPKYPDNLKKLVSWGPIPGRALVKKVPTAADAADEETEE